MESVLVALITAGIPAMVTIISGKRAHKVAEMHSARQSILQLILEDKVRIMNDELPENYQMVLDEFDIYKQNGGNSFICKKVSEYEKMLEKLKIEK